MQEIETQERKYREIYELLGYDRISREMRVNDFMQHRYFNDTGCLCTDFMFKNRVLFTEIRDSKRNKWKYILDKEIEIDTL